MKKHLFGKLLGVFMAVAMVFGLAACDPTNGGGEGEGEGGEAVYTVSFDLQGHGSPQPSPQNIEKGGHASRPATDPADTDYDFGGWYKESATTNEFNFETVTIEKDTTVYAKWTKKQIPTEDTSTKFTGKIYVVGDSTVCDYRPKLDDYYLPRYGYGTQLYNYINVDESNVVNLALSGRSSLSFLSEPEYATLQANIGAGDYLIIGFGHNDEKSAEAARFTDPNPDYQTPTTAGGKPSFQYTLYENYVKLAKDKGATPILCTPIVRYAADGQYAGKSVAHVTADGDYPAAIKKLGADTNTAVVDLTKLTQDYYTAHNDDAKYFHAFTTYNEVDSVKVPDGIDTTHINMYGAKMISYMFAKNLPVDCPLTANVKTNTTAPTYEVDFPAAIKEGYEKPVYDGFNPAEHASSKVDTIGGVDWYHTAMGVLGGNKAGNYSFTKDNGKYTIVADGGSKFAATQDGFGAIFTQIDIKKNFTVSAKVKVTGAPSSVNDQNAFGIMLRDDIYIDQNIGTITSNFVTASVTGAGKANMSRTTKTALEYDGAISYAQNTEYEITFIRVGQTITATVKQGSTTKTTTFTDTSFVGIDNNYFYLCLFANRGLTVEFSEVTFEITGDAQGA